MPRGARWTGYGAPDQGDESDRSGPGWNLGRRAFSPNPGRQVKPRRGCARLSRLREDRIRSLSSSRRGVALASVEAHAGNRAAALSELDGLEKDAAARGYLLFARKAAALRSEWRREIRATTLDDAGLA